MGQDLRTDTRKDKRLLVLLAFGVLIVLVRLSGLVPERKMKQHSWGWVEYAGTEDVPQRIVLPQTRQKDEGLSGWPQQHERLPVELTEPLQRHRAITVQGKGENTVTAATVSPRLAFLLGLPLPVNRAAMDELCLLQGIGPKLAASIIDYRQWHGRIHDAQDFRAVPGIGEGLAAKIIPQLTFE